MTPTEAKILHRRNTMYYYTEEFSSAAKAILDKIISTRNPIRIRATHVSIGTIRAQWYHGVRYLLDIHDDSGEYAKIYKQIKCMTYKDYIELHLKRTLACNIEPEVINPWKEELEHFLEHSVPNDQFSKKVSLTQEDINWINIQLAGLVRINPETNEETPLFFGTVDDKMILLIRDNV